MKLAAASLAAALALATALPASAQQKPEDEIRYRQSVLNVVGRACL